MKRKAQRELTLALSNELIYYKSKRKQSLLFSSDLFASRLTSLLLSFLLFHSSLFLFYSLLFSSLFHTIQPNSLILCCFSSSLFVLYPSPTPNPPIPLPPPPLPSLSLLPCPPSSCSLRCIAQSVGEARVSPLAQPPICMCCLD